MPDFQEYHGLRGVCDAKVLRDRLPRNPDDAIPPIYDQGDRIPIFTLHFSIHQEILELPAPRSPERPEFVTRPAAPDGQRHGQHIGRNPDFRAPALPGTWTLVGPDTPLDALGQDRLKTQPDLT